MTSEANLELLRHNRDLASQARADRITRTLHLVRHGHGQLTTKIVVRLTGWTQRSALRYLVALEASGLAEPERRSGHRSYRWRLTEQGAEQLTSARAA